MDATFLGFDTLEDARTFEKFLIKEGYRRVSVSARDEKTKLYKVYFDKKTR